MAWKEHNPLFDLHDVYVRYKKDTRAVIAWLVENSACSHQHSPTLTIRDLSVLADKVIGRKICMPHTIHFLFREVIKERTELSKAFRRHNKGYADWETAKHEHFTESLSVIYNRLCKRAITAGESPRPSSRDKHTTKFEVQNGSPENRFRILKPSCRSEEHAPATKSNGDGCCISPKQAMTVQKSGDVADNVPRLSDDTLGQSWEMHQIVKEMFEIWSSTEGVWYGVSDGPVALMVAAFVTNTALAKFGSLAQRLKIDCNIEDPETLLGRIDRQMSTCACFEGSNLSTDHRFRTFWALLKESWRHLKHLKASKEQGHCHICCEKPPSKPAVNIEGNDMTPLKDFDYLSEVTSDLRICLQSYGSYDSFVRVGSPLLAESGYFLQKDVIDSNGLLCTFGLTLMHESTKAYAASSQQTRKGVKARLDALRVAQEAIPSIKAVLDDATMPCRCHGTLAFYLQGLCNDLQYFLRSRCFTCYFESPWTSGSHILEIRDDLFYYGLCLLEYFNYVGCILHIYNALRQLTDFRSIPVLDHLIEVLKPNIFPGGVPTRNFKNSYLRHCGGRLKFPTHDNNHKSGCHEMIIPNRVAKARAGFGMVRQVNEPKLQKQRISLLHEIKNNGHYIGDEAWKRISGRAEEDNETTGTTQIQQAGFSRSECGHTNEQNPLDRLRRAVIQETKGPFPTLSINFFKVYLNLTRVVAAICDEYHETKDMRGRYCLCFVETFLSAADRCKGDEVTWRTSGCKEVLELCRKMLDEGFKDQDINDYLWRDW